MSDRIPTEAERIAFLEDQLRRARKTIDLFSEPGGSAWVAVNNKLPMEGERVIAHYKGVYHYRLVTFWTDGSGAPHFGFCNEPDGKGSQPATHWHSLPELPEMPNEKGQP